MITLVRSLCLCSDIRRRSILRHCVTIIANHIALRLLEKEKRRQTEPLDENIDLPTEDYDEQKEERIRSLETAVSQLPEQDRLIIEEHYYGNVPARGDSTTAQSDREQHQGATVPHP